jgi:hypothetical protein
LGEGKMLDGKVVEFKKKEKDQNQGYIEQIETIKEQFLTAINITEEEVMDREAINFTIEDTIAKKGELVFGSINDANVFALYLLSLPENENVSHYETISCVSRLSYFYKLKPIYKDETAYIFPKEELMYGVNLNNLNRELNKLKGGQK